MIRHPIKMNLMNRSSASKDSWSLNVFFAVYRTTSQSKTERPHDWTGWRVTALFSMFHHGLPALVELRDLSFGSIRLPLSR